MLFEEAVEHVLSSEGGYSNHPDDAGLETQWGISKRAYPNLNIRALTRDQAKEIYRRDYWNAASCNELPESIRLVHFDCAVNAGLGAAAKMLQEALKVTVDGVIGPKTLAAAGTADQYELREDYLWLRARHYARISRGSPSQQKFLPGWILRLISVRSAA